MKQRPSFISMLASVLSFGLYRPAQATPQVMQPTTAEPYRNYYGKSSGGNNPGLPWRKRRFRHMRGIATPDWQHGEPLYVVQGGGK